MALFLSVMSCMPDMGPRLKNQYKGYGTPCMRGRPKAGNTNTASELDILLPDKATISCKPLRFYHTTSTFTWRNDVYLTGITATFIRFCHQFILSIPFIKICFKIIELRWHLMNLSLMIFYSLECRTVYINTTLNCVVAFALCARSMWALFILISKNDQFCFSKVNNVTKQLECSRTLLWFFHADHVNGQQKNTKKKN